MRKVKSLVWVAVLGALVISALIFSGVLSTSSSATSIQNKIEARLNELGASDALDQGLVPHSFEEDKQYRLYVSAATGMEYYFDPESGELIKTFANSSENVDVPDNVINLLSENESAMTMDERFATAMEHAEQCVGDRLIGELRVSESSDELTVYIYEYYDGLKTGTEVDVFFNEDGQIEGSFVDVGTLFQRNSDGTYSLKGGENYISVDQAKAVAYDAMIAEISEEISSVDSNNAECSINNNADSVYYIVKFPFLDTCTSPCTRYCKVRVDVYTAEILAVDYTK